MQDKTPTQHRRTLSLAVLMMASFILTSCNNCEKDVEAVAQFLDEPANLACEADEDCQAVTINCHQFSGSYCGQVPLNREAAGSERWQELRDALADCDDGEACTTCDAVLITACVDGVCVHAS